MEIRELRAFLEVAREENMTRAAGNLHMSQPSLSKLIKSLEHELGAKLFVRRSFGLTLTKEGRVLRERARDLVGMANRIEDEFASLGNITGGIPDSISRPADQDSARTGPGFAVSRGKRRLCAGA